MNMDRCDENSRVAARSTGLKAVPMEMAKAAPDAANNRRALRDITSLMRPVSGPPPCPPAFLKKSLTDKKQDCDKKSVAPAVPNRPITRRFAAALKSKGGSQDLNLPSSSSSSLGTCTAIDVDDFTKQVNGLPMEEEMEEVMFNNNTYELKEVEMEDLEEEADDLMPDIDSCDRSNPLAVVDYVDDIYSFYRKTEVRGCASPDYMSSQFDINERMRGILIDWLIEVHYKFELMDETLFLMVNIIDRFLANHAVVRKKLQLVGVTAMLLACKYEEVSVPVVEDLILISDRAYTREEVLQMEKLIVNTLQFNFSVPTIYVFMRRFLKAADFDKKLELLSFFLVELCLVEYEMLRFQPSLLAAAAVYTAQCTLKGAKQWNRTCEAHTTYTEEQLMECARMMVGFHIKAGNGKLTGVHRKYSTFKFGFAAKYEPALFVLEA